MLTGGVIVKEVAQHFYVSESAILRQRTVKDGPRSDMPRAFAKQPDVRTIS